MTFERNVNLQTVNKLKEEINIKDNNLIKISKTNENLRENLKKLSEQVNNLFNQITKQKQFIKKLNEVSKVKEKNSFEEELKMKEIQLKSSQNLIEVLTKENNSLKDKLENYGDFNSKIQLLDSVKFKDQEIEKLIQEKKLLKKQLEGHKQCESKIENNIKSIKMLTGEIIKSRDKYNKIKNDYNNLNLKYKSLEEEFKKNENTRNKNNSFNQLDNIHNVDTNYINNIFQKGFQNTFKEKNNDRKNLSLGNLKNKFNKSKSTNNINSNVNYRVSFSLFTENEKKAISTLFNSQNELMAFNKKISILESYKNSSDNLLKSNIKKLQSELSNKEEQIHYLQSKNKENELRLVVSVNQINQTRNLNINLKKKINEQKEVINSVLKDIKKKNEENKNINIELNKMKVEMN